MNRVVGIETEYGCLASDDSRAFRNPDAWPVAVKNYLFGTAHIGAIDQHYRDYEEPPRNGGFLLNGGRLYIDMGHLEYSSPECLSLIDIATYDSAGDYLVQSGLDNLAIENQVSFIKNNIDHFTGATFGCHENYLMKREAQFTPTLLGALVSFLATRQLYSGAGRVGQTNPLALRYDNPEAQPTIDFQLSQRADHIVNDIYQWVQFNRAIINARDEPLADSRKYRRLHLLIGDSNISPFATALKVGVTSCILTLLEEGLTPDGVILKDAVQATREISRDQTNEWKVELENGKTCSALDVQYAFLELAQKHLAHTDDETDWVLEQWHFTLDAIRNKPETLIGGVDWISKKWLLNLFREQENLTWQSPILQSLDLEYHNINPKKGLFFSLSPAKAIGEFNDRVFLARKRATYTPPHNTRAHGRAEAVSFFQKHEQIQYVINWDSMSCNNQIQLDMNNPFEDYEAAVHQFLHRATASPPPPK